MTAALAVDSLRVAFVQEMETLVFNATESVILITRSVKVNSLLPSLGPTTTAEVASTVWVMFIPRQFGRFTPGNSL
jgi:hypothetical protein